MIYLVAAFIVAYVMAHAIPANLLARLRTIVPLPLQGEASQQQQRQHAQQDQPQHIGKHNEDGLYDPSPIDVAVVRIMLARSKRLPPDLVDAIFEMAEYWVRSTTAVDFGQMPGQARYMNIRGGVQPENEFMVSGCFPLFTSQLARSTFADHPPSPRNSYDHYL